MQTTHSNSQVTVGLLGYGTVGKGTHKILLRNAEEITRRAGRSIQIKSASVRNLHRETEGEITLTQSPESIVTDPEIDIVCELIGGTELSYELVKTAIEQGKHVVTANKALIAVHGNELFALAHEKGVMIAFEAAVAGGIPVIKAIREGLAGNEIEWLAGIINGTGNYILSEMRDRGVDFDTVLKEAQALGYAEADPTFDVEGIDAAHKLCILASIAFGIPLQFDKVFTEGISTIEPADVHYAEELGYRIKHLGVAKKTAAGVELRVHPTMIPKQRLIANVNGVMNAVLVKGDAVGPTLYYGPGAGAEATGSAVVADLVDVVRAFTTDPENRVPHLAFQADALADLPIVSITDIRSAYYLRLTAKDEVGVLADITKILGDQDISLGTILQKEEQQADQLVPIILLTHETTEAKLQAAITAIKALGTVAGDINIIRVESMSTD